MQEAVQHYCDLHPPEPEKPEPTNVWDAIVHSLADEVRPKFKRRKQFLTDKQVRENNTKQTNTVYRMLMKNRTKRDDIKDITKQLNDVL